MAGGARVLIVDDDRDIADLLEVVLADEGYAVSVLLDPRPETVGAAVAELEPDCVLLDGAGAGGYGASWDVAIALAEREPPVPVVMFTANTAATDEAAAGGSSRTQAARFAGVLPKPFDLDELLVVVARCAASARGESGGGAPAEPR